MIVGKLAKISQIINGLIVASLVFVCLFAVNVSAQDLPYGCNIYGEGEYSAESGAGAVCATSTEETGGSGGSSGGLELSNTGQMLAIGASLAIMLTSASLFVYLLRKKRRTDQADNQTVS